MLRWTVVRPGKGAGGYPVNGHIYYAGMDNNGAGSGKPSFFAGATSAMPPPGDPGRAHQIHHVPPDAHGSAPSRRSYDKKTGLITLRIPLADVGKPGQRDAALQHHCVQRDVEPRLNLRPRVFNLIDATPPFELVIRARTR